MLLENTIYQLLSEMKAEELVAIWNNYCKKTGKTDDILYMFDDNGLNEAAKKCSLSFLVKGINSNWYDDNSTDYYFRVETDDIVMFHGNSYLKDCFEVDDMIRFMLNNKDSLGNNEIKEVLESSPTTLFGAIVNELCFMDDEELISIWNNFVPNAEELYYRIYPLDDDGLSEAFQYLRPSAVIRAVQNDAFYKDDDYFYYDAVQSKAISLQSLDEYFDAEAVADYICDSLDCCENKKLRKIIKKYKQA